MNELNTALELHKATSRILRWRIPLFFALIANIAILARLAFAPAGVEAAQPHAPTASVAHQGPAVPAADTQQTAQLDRANAASKTTPSDIAAHAVPVPQVKVDSLRTPSLHNPPIVKPSPSAIASNDPVPHQDLPVTPAPSVSHDVTDFLPDLSDLADRWWPALESTAEAAAQFAAAQQSQVDGLSIGNAAENRVPVSFLVDGRVYTLHPGESHQFPLATSWNIQFHRGGNFGNANEPLTPGKYQFIVGADGWTLQPVR